MVFFWFFSTNSEVVSRRLLLETDTSSVATNRGDRPLALVLDLRPLRSTALPIAVTSTITTATLVKRGFVLREIIYRGNDHK